MLSAELHAKIKKELEKYPEKLSALLPSLKMAQNEVGYLPADVIAEVADAVGVSRGYAIELASFYTMLHREPVGGACIEVCVQLPCAVRGAERLAKQLGEALKIEPGHHQTSDGSVTLHSTVECFGSCHRAPMCRVNDEYWENLDNDGVKKMLAHVETLRIEYKKKHGNKKS